MTSFYILLRVHTYGQFPLNEANGRVIQWYPIKSGSQFFFRRFGYLMSVHRSDPGWSWMIWKLSEWLHFGVYGMVFWGAESISDIIFDRKALWWPNFQTLSYLCHFSMNLDYFFTNYHQFWYTETIFESLSFFQWKMFSRWLLLTATLDDFHTYLKIHSAPKLKILKNT